MSLKSLFFKSFVLSFFFALLSGCEEEEKKTIAISATLSVNEITSTSAQIVSLISDDGNSEVTARGVAWSVLPEPSIEMSSTNDGSGVGSFNSILSGLQPGTIYHVRAYAINDVGISFGNELTFMTLKDLAVVSTTAVTDIGTTTAKSGGVITSSGGTAILSKGICWSTNPLPTIDLTSKTENGEGSESFVSQMSGLTPGKKYYVRAYAKNSVGTSYGDQFEFATEPVAPEVYTLPVTDIVAVSAKSGGEIKNDGGAPVTARGLCWSTSPLPSVSLATKTIDGEGTGQFISMVTGLDPSTRYYVRAYATNKAGTSYGEEKSFVTISVPTLVTKAITDITANSAKSGGTITSDGGDPISAFGVCWGITPNPTVENSEKTEDGSGVADFKSQLANLTPDATYFVRAYAKNKAGIAYGNELTFKAEGLNVTDVDGNVYNMVKIGTQTWLSENLRTTRFQDGTLITKAGTPSDFSSGITAKYIILNTGNMTDETANNLAFGKLYNFFAVSDPRKLCPAGTHVPSDAEWETLISYVGGNDAAGAKLKESGTTYWLVSTSTNDYLFNARPGSSVVSESSQFSVLRIQGSWWTSTSVSSTHAHYRRMITYNGSVIGSPATGSTGSPKNDGYSVRCIKD